MKVKKNNNLPCKTGFKGFYYLTEGKEMKYVAYIFASIIDWLLGATILYYLLPFITADYTDKLEGVTFSFGETFLFVGCVNIARSLHKVSDFKD